MHIGREFCHYTYCLGTGRSLDDLLSGQLRIGHKCMGMNIPHKDTANVLSPLDVLDMGAEVPCVHFCIYDE